MSRRRRGGREPPTAAPVNVSVTIFADASWCDRTRAGGWGAWMKRTGRDALLRGGQLASLPASSTEAEMQAMANALHVGLRHGYVDQSDTVMVQSDCLNALKWILHAYAQCSHRAVAGGVPVTRSQKLSPTGRTSRGLEVFCQIAKQHNLHIIVRHVRGHQGGPNRQWVNRQCDEIAKQHMRDRREQKAIKAEAQEARA